MEFDEKRHILPDRRKRPTPIISIYTFWGGRRKVIRRESDRRTNLYVDGYSPRLLLMLLSLLFLNFLDTFITLTIINNNMAVEANPVMAFFLEYGDTAFILSKFFITATAVVVLCLLKNLYLARIGLPFLLIMYTFLIMYELHNIAIFRYY